MEAERTVTRKKKTQGKASKVEREELAAPELTDVQLGPRGGEKAPYMDCNISSRVEVPPVSGEEGGRKPLPTSNPGCSSPTLFGSAAGISQVGDIVA